MFPVKDRIWRLPPCPPYDVEGMESWLSEMGSQGWRLEPDDFFLGVASFRKTDPAPVRYRLEAPPKKVSAWDDDGGVPDREAWELNADCGWEYAGRRGQFFIYRTSDERALELHTDPRVQALAIRAVEKRQLKNMIALLAIMLAHWLALILRGGSLVLTAVWVGLPLMLLFLLTVLLALGILLGEVLYLRRLRRRLLAGLAPDREKDWRRTGRRYYGVRAAHLCIFLLFVFLALRLLNADLNGEDRIALEDYPGKPPFATVRDLAEGEYTHTWRDIHYNYVTRWSNAFLSVGMRWMENASVRRPDGTELHGSLVITYFEARSEWLAKLLAAAQHRSDRAKAWRRYKKLALPDLGLDYAAAYRNETSFPTVVLRRGSTVLHAIFLQSGTDDPLPPEEWAGIMAGSLS